jgi:hypothetical protein
LNRWLALFSLKNYHYAKRVP